MSSLAERAGHKPAKFCPHINTRTPIDICTGQYVRSIENHWLLDGGAAPVNGVVARSGYYKSTTVDKIVMNMLGICPGAEYLRMDTENTTTNKQRLINISAGNKIDFDQQVHMTNKGEMSFTEWVAFIKRYGDLKLQEAKELTVETPFLDQYTGKPIKMLIPTFVSLDSISNFTTDANAEALEKGIEDSSNNTSDMVDGRIKKRLLDLIITWAYRYNMYFFITAHIGEKKDMDPRKPTPKQNQWMTGDDKITNAGKNFLYLPNLSYQLSKLRPLTEKDGKTPLYPSQHGALECDQIEINKLSMKILRGKGNLTGTIIPTVMSQHLGILSDLSYYEYLRSLSGDTRTGNYEPNGFLLKGYNRYSPLLPDVPFARKTIRQTCKDDYRAERALEIMFQFQWITRYWNTSGYPYDVPATLEALVEGVEQSSRIVIDDIVQSRGYWTYDPNEKRQYMSVMDIFELIGMKNAPIRVQVPEKITDDNVDDHVKKRKSKNK